MVIGTSLLKVETNFSELSDPVAFLDNIKIMKFRWKNHGINNNSLINI